MTLKQRKALEIIVSGEFKTYEELSNRLKISPKTLYNWRQDEEFSNELDRRMKIKISMLAARALERQAKLLNANSEMVSHLAAKDLLDRAGFGADNNINIKSSEPIRIIDDIPKEGSADG